MECKYNAQELIELVDKQINNYWPYSFKSFMQDRSHIMADVLTTLEECLESLNNKYVHKDGKTHFNIEHSVSYSIFLYILSNKLYHTGEGAEYVYYLNKIMHSIDWFYAIDLPRHFGAEHPLGSVLGRANYGDYFFLYQGCTVGGNKKNGVLYYPVIGDYCVMFSNSSIIGKCHIGNNVILASECHVKDEDIPSNCIVFGSSPNLVIKERTETDMLQRMAEIWREK